MPGTDADVIDTLVGIKPGSALDAIRNRRPDARAQAQASYRALFEPEIPGEVSAAERFAVAAFVIGLPFLLWESRMAGADAAGDCGGHGERPLWLLSRRPLEPRGHPWTDPSYRR